MELWLLFVTMWCSIGLAAAGFIVVLAWRARGSLRWRRAIRKEMDQLRSEMETATPGRKRAIEVILTRCDEVLGSLAPEVGDIEQLQSYFRSIAACFFPDARHPENQVTLGNLVRSLQASLFRFDQILQRPGLGRIKTLKIRQINSLYNWSAALLKRPFVKWYMSHRKVVKRISHTRFIIFPDPFSWLFFLSQRLAALVILRNLIADITLFMGKLALEAYDCSREIPLTESTEFLEETLRDLSQMKEVRTISQDPSIKEIRKELLRFPALMFSTPTWADWKEAVRKSAEIIARKHFPDSDNPLAEAAIGPMLQRTRSWLNTISKREDTVLLRRIYKLRLETLFQAKDFTDLVLPTNVRRYIKYGFKAYGWLKWPWKVYRWSKRTSLPGIAVDLGWTFGKKSIIVMIYGRTFDQVCDELNWVYELSKETEKSLSPFGRG